MNKQHKGFTLLEVLVSLAITGMALGVLLALLGSGKQLAFKAADEIDHTLYLRAALNAAQLESEPKYPKEPAIYTKNYRLESSEFDEKPPRETAKILYTLEKYTLTPEQGGEPLLQSLRWKKLKAVR